MPDPRRLRFERLTLPLEKHLYHAALILAGQEADALDLVQETYVRAYRGFDSYRTDENIRGWMFTILRNAYTDRCRRKQIEPVLSELPPDSATATHETEPTPPEQWLPDDLLRALQSLSRPHRLLIQLVDVERLSYKEAAEALGIPIGSVMSGLHHARNRLRAALGAPATPRP